MRAEIVDKFKQRLEYEEYLILSGKLIILDEILSDEPDNEEIAVERRRRTDKPRRIGT